MTLATINFTVSFLHVKFIIHFDISSKFNDY